MQEFQKCEMKKCETMSPFSSFILEKVNIFIENVIYINTYLIDYFRILNELMFSSFSVFISKTVLININRIGENSLGMSQQYLSVK